MALLSFPTTMCCDSVKVVCVQYVKAIIDYSSASDHDTIVQRLNIGHQIQYFIQMFNF